jgi:hypothetical protein
MVCESIQQPVPAAPAPAPREVAQLELVFILDPRIVERARRLEFAMRHLRAGMTAGEVRNALRLQFSIPQPTAWRVVDMALDIAGPV